MFKTNKKYLIIYVIAFFAVFAAYFVMDYFFPKVSVITPIYNGEKYIYLSSDCLLNQTFKSFEIIYINDGSTDNTAKILQDIKKLHPWKRIRIYSQNNRGVAESRNSGLFLARGKYVMFLDVDDTFDKTLLEKMYKKAAKTDSDIVICHSNTRIGTKTFDLSYGLNDNYIPKKDVFSYKDIPEQIFLLTNGEVWDKLYRRKFLIENNIKFFPLKNTEDTFFCYYSLILAKRISTVKDVLVTYNAKHADSVSSNMYKHPLEPVKALLLLKENLDSLGVYNDVERSYINLILGVFIYNFSKVTQEQRKTIIDTYKTSFKNIDFKNKPSDYYFIPEHYSYFKKFVLDK